MRGDQSVDQFISDLVALCPGIFGERLLQTAYGQKFQLLNGCLLVISCTSDRAVSKLHTERGVVPSEVVEASRSLANKYSSAGSRQRNRLVASIDELERRMMPLAVVSETPKPRGTEGRAPIAVGPGSTMCSDPLATIKPVGTIRVRRTSRSILGAPAPGVGGPSGWSQAIGRRCEQFAFEWIAAQCGAVLSKGAGAPGPVRFYIGASDRMLIWLNAETEQGRSWDIEERDAITGEILRRHEVKARTGELTDPEYALAIEHGDAYMIWRADPDAGTCERLEAPARRPIGLTSHSLNDRSIESPIDRAVHRKPGEDADGPTMVVLGSSTRDFCRRLRRQHRGFVIRFRRNLVVVFRVTPELEAQLPPSKSRIWVANRSRAGCERLRRHVSDAHQSAFSRTHHPLLFIGLSYATDGGLARCIHAVTQSAFK